MNPRPKVAHLVGSDLSLRFLIRAQLRALRDAGFEVTGISAPGPYAAELEAEGIRHIALRHSRRAWSPLDDARLLQELIAIFRRERFDVVHTHFVKTGLLGRLAAHRAQVPHIINTVHGLYATPDDRPAKRVPVHALERLAARYSHVELYQSAEDLAFSRRKGIVRESRSHLIGNGIDLDRFDPERLAGERRELRASLGIPEDTLVIGMVGRLIANKGYREFFKAAEQVHRSHPDVVFLAVGGEDPEKDHFLNSDEIEAARTHVTFLGWREDIPACVAAMDVFALPSWREGMPRSAIEAAAAGRPLILTDIRGCREVARHEREGLLVPVRDPIGLAAAIERMVNDPSLRRQLGANARERALARFDERRVVELVVQRTRALIGGRGTAETTPSIRPARPGDAQAIAEIHARALPDAFLPALGRGFLQQLYIALSTDSGAATYVATADSQIVGFVAGVASTGDFYRRFYRRYGMRAAAAAAPKLLRPSVLRRAIETGTYGGKHRVDPWPAAELLAIAVEPQWRARGIGADLTRRMLDELSARGAHSVKVIVGSGNGGANAFYREMRFRPAGTTQVHDGSVSNVWISMANGQGAHGCAG